MNQLQKEAIAQLFKEQVSDCKNFHMCNMCGSKGTKELYTKWETHDMECSFMNAKLALEGKDLYQLWMDLLEEEDYE